ncbi:PDZ domain-containing protein [Streptomyces sp. NPDC006739]|uniref:PDZ domain-containing protein n=1 Tax=Streptomyces sp. NPDC006739 TaxID=3364763 RepID=UPI00369E2D7C
MEQTVLRPKPMPGRKPRDGDGDGGTPRPARRPHAARRRGRRIRAVLFGLFVGGVLVLSGVGIGTVGATVIGMSRLAELQRQARHPAPPAPAAPSPAPGTARAVPGLTLGVEAVDAEMPGALIVAVHVPGPGYTAGLVRGDVLLKVGATRVATAADLARAVAHTRPGAEVTLTVRHRGGGYQRLTAVPGVVV